MNYDILRMIYMMNVQECIDFSLKEL